jgi:hypothetical protein
VGRAFFTVTLMGTAAYLLWGPPGRLDTADKLASVGSLILAAGTLVLFMTPVGPVVVNEGRDDRVATDLGRLVERQWAREAAVRLLRRPQPLVVSWSLTGMQRRLRQRLFSTGSITHGDVTDLADTFRRLPAGRMVVVGSAGSGKTVAALLLTLDLLASRQSGEPVPVLLSVSSWDPGEHLDRWLARQVAEEYPTLTDQRSYGPDAVARLVRAGQILPILDGLDEIPHARRVGAIAALNTVLPGRRVVLTCRHDAYAEAVLAGGTPLDGAAVIELEPVTVTSAMAYLPAGQVDGVRRWARVVAKLRDHPHGPLAQALSTPLMLYLARTIYTAPVTDPADLADPTRFPSRDSIEDHLLNQYVPAVYGSPAIPPDLDGAAKTRRCYDPDQAQAWLAFLAARLPTASGDLAWWNLPRCVARWRLIAGAAAGSVAGLCSGLAAATATTLVAGRGWGLFGGLSSVLFVGTMCGWEYSSDRSASPLGRPHRVRLRLRALLRPTRASLVRGGQCAVVIGIQVGVFIGLATGFRHGASAGIRYGTITALLVGPPAGVVEFLAQNMTGLASETDWVSPRSSLAGDRTACLLHASVGAVIFGPTFGLIVGLLTNPLKGAVAGLVSGIAAVAFGAVLTGFRPEKMPGAGLRWIPFTIARISLATSRRIPPGLFRFLEDAHARGVLRQTGAVYQFRHARVRDHLALKALEPTVNLRPLPVEPDPAAPFPARTQA